MGRERYVVDAVVLEGRSRREVARLAGVSKGWVDALVARYRAGGYDAIAPRSRRPRSCPHAVPPELQPGIVALRHELTAAGHDHGPHTIAHPLRARRGTAPSVATIWRILRRQGLITPQPQKRPRSSFIRFAAALPNELWQADTTHWQLADGSDVEILNCLDDHSRLLVVSENYPSLKTNAGFQDLRAQLEGTENRIGIARNRYIKAVQDYNVLVRQFPVNLTAMVFGYKEKPNFTVDNEKEISTAPKVYFGPLTPTPTK